MVRAKGIMAANMPNAKKTIMAAAKKTAMKGYPSEANFIMAKPARTGKRAVKIFCATPYKKTLLRVRQSSPRMNT